MNLQPVSDPTRVSVAELIQLAAAARELPIIASGARAHQSGGYLSAFKGRGMEFDEVRPYQAGDDIRHLDWKVTARTGDTYTKLFRQERERPVLLWVDLRPAMFFATRGVFKSVIAARLATLLAWRASRANDRVGGLVFTATSHEEIKPGRGKTAVLHFLQRLAAASVPPADAPHLQREDPGIHALARLRRVAKPGSLIFLISDFRGLLEAARQDVARLSRHNDVMLVHVYDPLEAKLPPPGRYRVSDGHAMVDLNSADRFTVDRYAQRFNERRMALQELVRRLHIRLLDAPTDIPPLDALRSGLKQYR